MKNNLHINASYDDIADVMYLTSAKIVHTKNEENEAGLVLRYDLKTHKPVGVTIIDFKEYWMSKEKDLTKKLSNFFNVSEDYANSIIHSVH